MFMPSKPKIRTRTEKVPVKKAAHDAPRSTSQPRPTNGTANGARVPGPAHPPANRYSLTPSNKLRRETQSVQSRTDRKPLPVGRAPPAVRKRKVTPSTPQWASSDDSSADEDPDRLGSGLRKRQKTSSSIEPMAINRCLEPDLKRRIRMQVVEKTAIPSPSSEGVHVDAQEKLIQGLDMCRGEWAKDFKPAFPGKENIIVTLQYPSTSDPEKFETAVPNDPTNFNPLDDIYFSIDEIVQHYLPPDIAVDLLSETQGAVRLLKRAVAKNAPEDFASHLEDFNKTIRQRLGDGTIATVLDNTHAIPLSLTRRILAQVYQRTVSPHAHLLRKVKDKETTYGELLPPFVHTIFHQTHLTSSSVFVDLGSGVGNVVLQSALQTGAESWGIELMETPAQYASAQALELRARAKLWNISLGSIHLLHGSFLDSPEIDAVLQRADVVLVNNKVFEKETNANLLNKFLDLKLGCRVVSLESFGGGVGKHGVRNEHSIASLFEEERHESGTNSVSWTGESVEYYIATKAR
jgi:H3 lysine-79-specific histone-lysine N-methyltransferase